MKLSIFFFTIKKEPQIRALTTLGNRRKPLKLSNFLQASVGPKCTFFREFPYFILLLLDVLTPWVSISFCQKTLDFQLSRDYLKFMFLATTSPCEADPARATHNFANILGSVAALS
jgi:hypothetical protein